MSADLQAVALKQGFQFLKQDMREAARGVQCDLFQQSTAVHQCNAAEVAGGVQRQKLRHSVSL